MKCIVLVCALMLAGCTKESSRQTNESMAPAHQGEKERQMSQTQSPTHEHEETRANGEQRHSQAE